MRRLPRSAAPLVAVAVIAPVLATLSASPASATPGCPSTPSFEYSIPEPVGPPGASALTGGGSSIVYAAVGADSQTYSTVTDISGDPLQVSELTCYGGLAADSPGVAGTGTDSYSVFVRGTNSRIYERRVTATSTGTFTAVGTGQTTNGPAAARTSDGKVHLVVRGTTGSAYYAVSSSPGVWSGFVNLGGGILGSPTVVARPGGGLAVFARGTNSQIYIDTLVNGVWSGWSLVPGGGASSNPPTAAVGFASNRLDLFVTGTAGGMYQQTWTTTGGWVGWKQLDTTLPSTARLGAAATPSKLIIYAAAEEIVAYKQYLAGWQPYFLAPYTCEQCLPSDAAAKQQAPAGKRTKVTWPTA